MFKLFGKKKKTSRKEIIEKILMQTKTHKALVESCIYTLVKLNEDNILYGINMMQRAIVHDNSRLYNSNEFDENLRVLNGLMNSDSGSRKYSEFVKDYNTLIEYHNIINDHHPEYFDNKVDDMSKFQLDEMICDMMAVIIYKKHHEEIKPEDIQGMINEMKESYQVSKEKEGYIYNTMIYLLDELTDREIINKKGGN